MPTDMQTISLVEELVGRGESASSAFSVKLIEAEENYTRVPPYSYNENRLDPSVSKKIQGKFGEKIASLPPKFLISVNNALAFHTGVIVFDKNKILKESIQNNKNYMNFLLGSPEKYVSGKSVLLRKAGDNNYGHWLVELLPKAITLKENFKGCDLNYLLPKHPIAMQSLRLASLEMCGIKSDNVVWIDDSPLHFEELITLSPNSIHSHTHTYLGLHKVRAAAATLPKIEDSFGELIFIGRKPITKRRCVNEAEIVDFCQKYGFRLIYPEDYTLNQQIAIFSQARFVISTLGAALTNVLWCNSECKIIALTSSVGEDFFFWDISNIMKHEYNIIYGAPSDDPGKGVHQNFTVPLKDFSLAAEEIFSRWGII
jgi:hypothetical protein